jgi:hypothetical protein
MKKVVLVFILFNLIIISNSFGATKLFSDGFESGNFSNWNTVTSGITISSNSPHSGGYCARVDYGSGSLQGLIKSLSSAPKTEFYVAFYVKIASSYNAPYLGFKWMRLKHGAKDGIQTEFYLKSENWLSDGHSYQTGQGALDFPGTGWSWYPAFDDAKWHKIEVYGKYNTGGGANGICRIWFDGKQRLNETSYKWRTGEFANDIFKNFYIPSNAGDGKHGSRSGDIIYIDDVQIWNGMPGGNPSEEPPIPSAPTGLRVIE